MSSLQALALRRAQEIVGGIDMLEARLDISRSTLSLWMQGKARVPETVFLRVVDLISEAELAALRKPPKETPKNSPS